MATPLWRAQLSRRHIQITLGVLWLLDGALQFQPFMYRQQFVTSVLAPNATGQPALIGRSIAWAVGLVSHHLIVANTAFAVIQVLIGAGLLVRPAVRPALVASLVWGLAVWWVGEGFGLLLTGHASPATGAPGAVLLYVVIAALAWPAARADGPGDNESPIKALPAKVAWALLWCGAGLLWLLPANRAAGSLHDAVASAAAGQPAWVVGTAWNCCPSG